MTFEEAKKILEKEVFGIRFKKFDKPLKFEEKSWIRNEKPEVLEALHIVAKNGIGVSVPETALRIRSLIIKKMKAREGEPAPVSGTPLSAAEGMKLRWKDNKNTDKNPALEEAATQFNDALLDEQAKKIAELTKDKELMKKATLSQLDDFIEIYNLLTKESQKTKRLGKEIAKLNGIIHDKNAVLSDVAEELRLSKIREKNLTEVCQKYVKEVEDLRKQLANKVVDKIDAQALKSAESALAWKEKLIYYKDMAIADLRKELKAQKGLVNHISKKYDGAKINLNLRMKECEELREKVAEKTKLVEIVRKGSREYCEYGIAAEKMIQKMAKVIVGKGFICSEDFEKYRLWANGYRFNPQLPDFSEEEEKKLSLFRDDSVGAVTNQKDCSPVKDTHSAVDIADEGKDLSGVIVLCGKDFIDAIKKMK